MIPRDRLTCDQATIQRAERFAQDPIANRLMEMSEAEIAQWCNDNVTDLASARAHLTRLTLLVQHVLLWMAKSR